MLIVVLNLKIISCQAVVAIGGSQEVILARPGNYKIILRNRKGFVKIAIQTGASLVPVISFGENELFDQPSNEPGTILRRFQDVFKTFIGVVPPIIIGRGFFQYSFGVIPRRLAITTVVGAPIQVNKAERPTDKEISELHEKFIAELTKLFDVHKGKYLNNFQNDRLIIN